MGWLFRPATLFLISVALSVTAGTLLLWPRDAEVAAVQPVPEGDAEIVWLDSATSAAPWERFVTAMSAAAERIQRTNPSLRISVDEQAAFPRQTTAVPEVALTVSRRPGRLWFRWYKATSDLKAADWIRSLLARRPAPLAIIGGSSSDVAIELAIAIGSEVDRQRLGAGAPLLLLTTATADEANGDLLTRLYPNRTFRFCFTNQQMADAVTDFIWSQDDLRPDRDPVYLTYWDDDPYSRDLNQRFCLALQFPANRTVLEEAFGAWAHGAGFAVAGGLPFGPAEMARRQFRGGVPFSCTIPYSIGTFDHPNRFESKAAREVVAAKLEHPDQKRPLLILPAAAQPAHRFLRALARIAPMDARRFIVATGDAIAFNTLYRDRNDLWPIQDLPFPLVFFCHRNPVEFEANATAGGASSADDAATDHPSPAGTEDLLLFSDIIDAVVSASYQGPHLQTNAGDVGAALRQMRWHQATDSVAVEAAGVPLFDENGNRRSGTGEHIVYVRPVVEGEEVLPQATIAVWSWEPEDERGRQWQRRRVLTVDYEGAP
jgi:hypothetical protein